MGTHRRKDQVSKYVKDTGSPVSLSEKELRDICVLGSNVNCKYNVISHYDLNPFGFQDPA